MTVLAIEFLTKICIFNENASQKKHFKPIWQTWQQNLDGRGKSRIAKSKVFFPILWGRWTPNRQQEEKAKFGWKHFRIVALFWWALRMYCLHMETSDFFPSKYGNFGLFFHGGKRYQIGTIILKWRAPSYWCSGHERTPPFPFRPIYGKLFQITLCWALWNIEMWSSHHYFIILPSCQLYIFYFSILPNCQVQLMCPWIYLHGMELDPWKVMKSWGEINSFQKYLFHPWNVVLFKILFFASKAIQISWMHMHKISWIVSLDGGGDESSCMKLGLPKGISLVYGHATDIYGCHGFQQWAKCSFKRRK
jgi:hypothetical protein